MNEHELKRRPSAPTRRPESKAVPLKPTRTQKSFAAYQEKLAATKEHGIIAEEHLIHDSFLGTATTSRRRMKYEDHWTSHPDELKRLLYWYPHWGAEPLAKELNIPIHVIQQKARKLNLKLLHPRDRRICYYCRVSFIGKHKKFGLRCIECFKPYRADKKRTAIHQNPLKERLRELVHQMNSRNVRKGLQTKISTEDLLQIWNRQGGRCAYSGRKMLVSSTYKTRRSPDTLSVDRIDSRNGYSINNIVLCTWWANVAKYDLGASAFIERCREVIQKADSIQQGL